MSEWKEDKLKNIGCKFLSGFAFKSSEYKNEGIPLIKIGNIQNRIVDINASSDFVSEGILNEKVSKYLLSDNDVLIAMTGQGSVGRVGRLKLKTGERALLNQRVGKFICDEKNINLDFLFYVLASEKYQDALFNAGSGSGQPNLSPELILDFEIHTPSYHEQTAIAEVLSSLDDKIDLLHRQNKTLEQLAETLFRQWFVESNNSTEIIELGSLVITINGVSYKSTELNSSRTAMVSLKSFDRNGGFRIDGFKEFTGKYKEQQTVKEGDLVVAHTDITQDAEVIGNPALVVSNPKYTTMVISMDMVKVIPKVDWISIEFLYFLMRTREFKGHCEGNANGSTVLHLSKQAIPTFEFVKPNKEKVIEFTRQSKELLSKTFENHRQIRTLTQLRDTLLPKLMSGEVKVNI